MEAPDPWSLIEQGERLSEGGDPAGAEAALNQALEASRDDPRIQAAALLRLAGVQFGTGRIEESRASLQRAADLAASVGDEATRASAEQLLGTLTGQDPDEGTDGVDAEDAGPSVTRGPATKRSRRRTKSAPTDPVVSEESGEVIAGFTGDHPDASNRLGRAERDVEVMAALVASHHLQPPLAIGVFGEWGSGKSSFMRQLAGRIAKYQGQEGFTTRIRQVEFNAWHYAETELMASLLYEVWKQTADEGLAQQLRQESLTKDLQDKQAERQRLHDQQATEALPRSVATVADQLGGQDLRLGELPAELEGAKYARNGLRLIPTWVWVLVVGLVGLAVLLVVMGLDLAAAATAVLAGVTFLEPLRRSFRGLAELSREQRQALEPLDREIADLRARLAQEPESAPDLDSLILQFKASADLRGRLGITATAYEQLKPLSDRLRDSDTRIVLYVDDLDRCDPDRVVAVLETVHLLLALPAFVVVVAVDPRWLENSLIKKYTGLLEVGAEARQIGTPVEYLEKIFQIPYRIPAYTESTDFGQFVTYLTSTPGAAPAGPRQTAPAGTPAPDPAVAGRVDGEPVQAPPVPLVTATALDIGASERTVILAVMPLLRTPRNGVRLVNLYRLIRASLDQDQADIARLATCILLLALQIGFPDHVEELLARSTAGDADGTFWTAADPDEEVMGLFTAIQEVPPFDEEDLTRAMVQECLPLVRRFSFHNPPPKAGRDGNPHQM